MKTAGDLIGILVKFPASMELGHDDFGGGDTFFGMDGDGDAAAIITDGARAVGVQNHLNAVGMSSEAFVDRIIDNLINHVMQARAVIRIANIHAGAFAVTPGSTSV